MSQEPENREPDKQETTAEPAQSKLISRSALILMAFAIACTALVTATHIVTAPKIAEQQKRATLNTLLQVIPRSLYDNPITSDCLLTVDANGKPIKVFRARIGNDNKAMAIETIVPDGYNGRIDLLVALDTSNKILGVRTTQHQETPGLGDKVEIKKSDWIDSFNGTQVKGEDDKRWNVRKDGGMFDQFTGATITPRAVVKGVKRTALWYQQQQTRLFEQTSNCEKTE